MNSQEDPGTRYQSYMLRVWRTRDSAGLPVWRASLEEPGSGRRESFGDLSAMWVFLLKRLGIEQHGETAPPEQQQAP